MVRCGDSVPAFHIDSHLGLDARVAWRPYDRPGLVVAGRDLLSDHHQEYDFKYVANLPSEIERSVYARVTWQF